MMNINRSFILSEDYLQLNNEWIVYDSPVPLKVVSSGVTGAGFGIYKTFVNRHVDKDYNPLDYKQEMDCFLQKKGLEPNNVVSMMTSVKLSNVVYQTYKNDSFSIFVVVTAGTGNAVDASLGNKHFYTYKQGTINTWIFINGNVTEAAFIQAIVTATEAKTIALREAEITDHLNGTIATGTSTDSILIAATQAGYHLEFAGPISELGALIGQAVYECTTNAIQKSGRKK